MRSKLFAKFFSTWLPQVIQATNPFFSEMSIEKGDNAIGPIKSALRSAEYGIVFVTRDNYCSGWLNNEVGAMWLRDIKISPVMLDEAMGPINGMISHLQQTRTTKESIYSLIKAIRNACCSIDDKVLEEAFDRGWSMVDKKIKESSNLKKIEDAVKGLPPLLKQACIAESKNLLKMDDSSSAYNKHEKSITPCGLPYKYKPVKEGAFFYDVDGIRRDFHEVHKQIKNNENKEELQKYWRFLQYGMRSELEKYTNLLVRGDLEKLETNSYIDSGTEGF